MMLEIECYKLQEMPCDSQNKIVGLDMNNVEICISIWLIQITKNKDKTFDAKCTYKQTYTGPLVYFILKYSNFPFIAGVTFQNHPR